MNSLPKASCPNCKGPVTFVQVMSIVTPFQSIDCTTCGEMLFLVHRTELLIVSVLTAFLLIAGGSIAYSNGWMSAPALYGAALVYVVVTELAMTTIIVKKNALVIRKNK
jgi:hypothetical protein